MPARKTTVSLGKPRSATTNAELPSEAHAIEQALVALDNPHIAVLFKYIVKLLKDSRRPEVTLEPVKKKCREFVRQAMGQLLLSCAVKVEARVLESAKKLDVVRFFEALSPKWATKILAQFVSKNKKASAGWDDETHKDLRTSVINLVRNVPKQFSDRYSHS